MGKKKDLTAKHANSANDENNKRIKLWAHCVSKHAVLMSPETSLKTLKEFHGDEHTGPCTIRNHDVDDLGYSLKEIGKTLIEDDPYQGEE